MSQPNYSATSRRGDDEYEFPDELEGIDWSAVGPIEGDEPKPETTAPVSEHGDQPLVAELLPRPGSSSNSYEFPDIETLDEDDLAELDETERLYGLTTGEIPENTPSSSAQTLDTIFRPVARLPTADNLVLSSSQSSTPYKRKLSSQEGKSSPLKKSRTLPLECIKSSSKGKETARGASAQDIIRVVYDSLVETCSCPICYHLFAIPFNIIPCGHTMCGACLCDWIDRSCHDASCPICRQALNDRTSLSRNYIVESVMDQQVRILATHEHPGWGPLGTDVLEWTERKTSFLREASVRLARARAQITTPPLTVSAPPAPRPPRRRGTRGRDRD